MLAALAAVLLQQQAPFVPALNHGSRSVAQWIEELEHGSRPLDAVWSLYYADDRSAAVLAALKDALAPSRPPECRMAADTILCQWRVEHELLPAEVYSGGKTLAEFAQSLAPPPPLREGETARRLEQIQNGEPNSEAWRALLDLPASSEWAAAHAGSAWYAALGERLTQAQKLDEALARRPDWARALALDVPGRTAALPALARFESGAGADAQRAHDLVQPMLGMGLWGADRSIEPPYILASILSETPATDDPFLADYVMASARRRLEQKPLKPESIQWLLIASIRVPAVAELCSARLAERLEDKDEPTQDVLRLLTRIGSRDVRVRAAYLRALRGWTNLDHEGLERVPLWREHDPETRKAFLELLTRAMEPDGLELQLEFAGEVDASRSGLARVFLERTRGVGAWLVSRGFRGHVEVDRSLSLATQVNQIALNIAGKQAAGQDFADDERSLVEILSRPYEKSGAGGYDDQVQWGLFHAQELGLRSPALVKLALHYIAIGDTMEGFSTHAEAAEPYLESIPLAIEDHLELRRLRGSDPNSPGWRGINLANPRFGGVPVSPLSLEDAPHWRQRFLSGAPQFLAQLVRVTPLTPRELPFVLALLERGSTLQRLWTLSLVEEFHLDTPGLREAIARRADHDLDDSVRRRARAVVDGMR